jgi:GH24 family phage-related lysozyme (muramidase)
MAGNPTTEQIDERILGLLGLEDEYELSYEEYVRHLKEAMVVSRMSKSKFSTEESELFTNEWKRVKSKKGRFKPKKKKITAAGLGIGARFTKPLLKVSQQKLMLSPSKGLKIDPIKKENEDVFARIDGLLTSILANITEQNKEAKKQADLDKKDKENKKRKQKELGLEKTKEGLKTAIQAITKPFQSILDKIINFFVMTFLGKAVFKLITWFGNPENKKKVDTIIRFLKDWWPAIVGGFVLFGTRFGKGVRILTNIALSAISKLAKAIPALLRFGRNNPKAALGIATGTWAATQLAQRAFSSAEPEKKLRSSAEPEKKLRSSAEPEQKLWGGGIARKTFARGGKVSGPGGVDKVPAWLTHGEFVMSKGAVQKYGVGALESMNAAGGGTNVPTIGPAGVYAAGGGAIGQAAELIKGEEALSSLSPGTNDYVVPNGKSVVSGTNWSKIKPETTLHAYPDSRGIPTIGWGSTFYDKLTQGIKPVKLGDTITKEKADKTLNTHIGQISSLYNSKMPNWKNMSSNQQAAILSIGYNAGPNAPLGSYPKLSMALKSGDMTLAAQNVFRSGPSIQRIKNEQKLLLSGPKDTSKAQAKPSTSTSTSTSKAQAKPSTSTSTSTSKPQTKPSTPPPAQLNPLQRVGQALSSIFRAPAKKKPIIINAGSNSTKSGGKTNPPTTQQLPASFSATHRNGTRIAEAVYGVNK